MSLVEKLETTLHREVAGSDAYAAFEFQLMFGLELLFENYDKLDDFAVLFEFHDDIVLLTGTAPPTEIEFFQLKHTTKGNWSLSRLSHQPKSKTSTKSPSIIQKLYGNVQAFYQFTKNAQVVSNSYCMEFGQSGNSSFTNLSDDKKKKLLDHLKETHPGAKHDVLTILGFRRTELDKTACHEIVKGRIHSFLQRQVGGDAFQLDACTNAIVGQCRIRNKKLAIDVPQSMHDIVLHKGITKGDIDHWLTEIATNKNAPDWSIIQPHLGAGWSFLEVNSIRLAYENFKVEALDNSNDAQNHLISKIREHLSPEDVSTSLSVYIDEFTSSNNIDNLADSFGYSAAQLKSMVLYELFKSEQAGTVQEVNTKPAEED